MRTGARRDRSEISRKFNERLFTPGGFLPAAARLGLDMVLLTDQPAEHERARAGARRRPRPGCFPRDEDHCADAAPVLEGYLKANANPHELVVVAPDAGRVKVAERYAQHPGWATLNRIETVGSGVIALAIASFLLNLVLSLRRRVPAGDDPWLGRIPGA